MFKRRIVSGVIATAFTVGALLVPAVALAQSTVSSTSERLGGLNRFETAAIISQAGWQESADYAILAPATDKNLVDALTAAPLAKAKDAPILLTDGAALNADTEKELKRLGVSTVYVVSGTEVIKPAVISKLESMNITVKNLGGSNRFATSVNIAKELGKTGQIVVATAYSNADSLSIASIAAAKGMPILLAKANSVPAEVKDYVESIKAKVKKTYILGQETALSETVKAAMPNPVRVGGADRFATNQEIIKTFIKDLKQGSVYVANGLNAHLVDALTGAPLAAKAKAPIVLVKSNSDNTVVEFVQKNLLPINVTALGGDTVVSSAVVTSLKAMEEYTENGATVGAAAADSKKAMNKFITLAGDDITLQNATLAYSVYIKGNNASLKNLTVAGTVFVDPGDEGSAVLDGIKADRIVVMSGASHSIVISNSEAGSTIVSSTSSNTNVEFTGTTKVGKTEVTTYAIIDAQGAEIGTVTVSSEEGQDPVVEIRGTLKEEVVVEGQVTLKAAAGAVIPEVVVATTEPTQKVTMDGEFQKVSVKSETTLKAAAGTNISQVVIDTVDKTQSVTLDGTFKSVEVNNAGTVALSDNATVTNLKTNTTTTVTVPPTAKVEALDAGDTGTQVGGGGTVNGEQTSTTPTTPPPAPTTPPSSGSSGSSQTQISINSLKGLVGGAEVPINSIDGTYEFDLMSTGNQVKLTGLKVAANVSQTKLVLTSIKARDVEWLNSSIEADVASDGTITTEDLLGNIDSGAPGVALGNLRLVFGTGDVTLRGYLKKSGYTSSSVVNVKIKLGNTVGYSSISNEWVEVEKGEEAKTVIVTIKNPAATIGDLRSDNFDLTQVISSIATDGIGSSTLIDSLQDTLERYSGDALDTITLELLKDETFTFGDGYTVIFQ